MLLAELSANMIDGLFVGCFGTKNSEVMNRTFLAAYKRLKSKAKVDSTLALLNHSFADSHGYPSLSGASEVLSHCKNVIALPLMMADGSQYQLFKEFCLSKGYRVLNPLLDLAGMEIAELLGNTFQYEENTHIILLAHGSNGYDNHEYHNLQKLLRKDFTVFMCESGASLEDLVRNTKEEKVILFCLMFCCGHHFKEQSEVFREYCKVLDKQYEIVEYSIGEMEEFRDLICQKVGIV